VNRLLSLALAKALLLLAIMVHCAESASASASRRFEFYKRRQLFIGAHNETLSITAMRVSNELIGLLRLVGDHGLAKA
jgi:hypothetical protein